MTPTDDNNKIDSDMDNEVTPEIIDKIVDDLHNRERTENDLSEALEDVDYHEKYITDENKVKESRERFSGMFNKIHPSPDLPDDSADYRDTYEIKVKQRAMFKRLILISGIILLAALSLLLYFNFKKEDKNQLNVSNIQPRVLGAAESIDENFNEEAVQVETDNQPVAKEKSGEAVVYYGTPRFASTGACSSFYYYNIQKNELEKPGDSYHWFWACLKNDDPKITLQYYKLFHDKHVFKITGTANDDDLGYYGSDKPVKDITIERVEVIN